MANRVLWSLETTALPGSHVTFNELAPIDTSSQISKTLSNVTGAVL